jgi:hypothetical protein
MSPPAESIANSALPDKPGMTVELQEAVLGELCVLWHIAQASVSAEDGTCGGSVADSDAGAPKAVAAHTNKTAAESAAIPRS